jgi:hypothetical protein
MLKFKDFVTESHGYGLTVVSISKDKVDLSNEDTRNEINKNLAAVLSDTYINPYSGWLKSAKILSMYSIPLPRVLFKDAEEGEEVVAINQFGQVLGAKTDGSVELEPEDNEYYFYYDYGIGESGFYEVYAVVTDEEGLNELIEDDFDDADVEYEDPEGDKDPRQP